MYLDFPRLIHAMDGVAESSSERVVVQTGMGAPPPAHCEHFDFKSREDVIALQRDARVIVCHGGIGSVIDALQVKNLLVVVPRLRKFVEHNNDHQLEIGEAIVRRGWGRMVTEIEDLAEACANPPEAYVDYAPAKDELVGHIRATLLS